MMKYKPNYTRITNKLGSLFFIGLGVAVTILDNDATFLVFSSTLGIPLFFSREKIFN